jgi:hypothetical protein
METKYFFEELQLPEFGEGALFYGHAILSGDGDEFVVSSIRLGNDVKLDRPPNDGGGTLSAQLFKAIEAVLYDERTVNGRHAALEWADAVTGNTPAVPMFRDKRLMRQLAEGARL